MATIRGLPTVGGGGGYESDNQPQNQIPDHTGYNVNQKIYMPPKTSQEGLDGSLSTSRGKERGGGSRKKALIKQTARITNLSGKQHLYD